MARVVLPGVPLHVTQRGIRRFDVFRDESDRHIYLKLLSESCARFRLRISAYCLMTNHVHLVAIPEREDSLWRTLHRCHGVYATRFNMNEFWGQTLNYRLLGANGETRIDCPALLKRR
jgi:REP-associated tyrosine transposase